MDRRLQGLEGGMSAVLEQLQSMQLALTSMQQHLPAQVGRRRRQTRGGGRNPHVAALLTDRITHAIVCRGSLTTPMRRPRLT